MRALAVVLLLLVPALLADAQAPATTPDPRTQSPRYDLTFSVVGKVVDADGRTASRFPVTVEVEGPRGAVAKPVTVVATCFGEFDAYWPIYNLSDRLTVKVTAGGLSFSQPVDVLHRRNDFAIQLDRTLEKPTEAQCASAWDLSDHRATFVGQFLRETPPYRGPADNELRAEPIEGQLVTLRWVDPAGRVSFPQFPVYTNEEGVYKYAFTNAVDGPEIAGYVQVWFDDPTDTTNVTLEDGVRYHVVSRPEVRPPRPAFDSPAPAVASVALAVALALALRRR